MLHNENNNNENRIDLIPASAFSYEELTDAYNQTRVDYIVPMPMNAKKLREYVTTYDVDMNASAVAVDGNEILGLGMLGVREKRAWITRLGIIRSKRRRRAGWTIVTHLIEQAKQAGAEYIVIEVINDNIPAHTMFIKKGFHKSRELLVLRRPPSDLNCIPQKAEIKIFTDNDLVALLNSRRSKPSWVDEYESLLNAGNLHAFSATMSDGSQGWLVYQNMRFELGRLVIQTEIGDPVSVGKVLLCHLHSTHPIKDTKTENLPADDPHWPAFQAMGYITTFRRTEMVLYL